ncbi:anti-adapter protein IraP [Candidatus Pantoea persica]|uniref:anti-adapter protein IraP n=1 Tax=Candidatus Pantoea persica TaxID=2518128 RepID=UPI00215D931E|nr:anti-adapter protein IraP [Candidatus Pantoea persica]MBA2815443.1 Anti-adapter protein IraP [Candidatus Pantoea persica]
MKNLIAELLVNLAEKEEESKELVAQVEALEIVVTAMLRKLEPEQQHAIASGIDNSMRNSGDSTHHQDALLLRNYLDKLLTHPRV